MTSRARDLVFLLDESGSVGVTAFELVKNVSISLIDTLCGSMGIHQQLTRVAVATFDKLYHVHFDLDNENMNDKPAMLKSIREIKYNATTAGKTCLVRALNESQKMFHQDRGGRDDSERLLFLVTDGCFNCENDHPLIDVQEELSYEGINIMTLHIADDHGEKCSEKLEVLHNDSRCLQVTNFYGWKQLEDFFLYLTGEKCAKRPSEPGVCGSLM